MKTAIITGGNTGLGFQCARFLAQQKEWRVVIACRDPQKAEKAVEALIMETGTMSVESFHLDLASLDSIRSFADSWKASRRSSIDALICNAGTQPGARVEYTVDGFESAFGTNHLGHFLLVNSLAACLAARARVIVVGSGTHDPETIDGAAMKVRYTSPEELAWPGRGDARVQPPLVRYSTSKLCNLLFAFELDRRLRLGGIETGGAGVTANAFDPGANPDTALVRGHSRAFRALWRSKTVHALLRLLGMRIFEPAVAGKAMADLALDPSLEGVGGRYFTVGAEAAPSTLSRKRSLWAELWAASERMVGLAVGPAGSPLPSERRA